MGVGGVGVSARRDLDGCAVKLDGDVFEVVPDSELGTGAVRIEAAASSAVPSLRRFQDHGNEPSVVGHCGKLEVELSVVKDGVVCRVCVDGGGVADLEVFNAEGP